MEYTDLVSQIIAAEHKAQAIAQEAKERERSLDTDIQQAATELHDSYMDRARCRLEKVAETEETFTGEAIAELDEKHRVAMAAVEAAYEKNHHQWVDTLFHIIVGEPA